MKKSLSAPNLPSLSSNGSRQANSFMVKNQKPKMNKSVSACALNMTIDPVTVLETMVVELQIESVLKVTSIQAGTCGLNLQTFPYEVLNMNMNMDMNMDMNMNNEKARNIALCLAEPTEKDEINDLPRLNSANTYLELCETNKSIRQRFCTHLNRIRRSKRHKKANI